jgi:hypothetical protein
MKEIPKKQKIYLAAVLAACVLVVYGVGTVTDLFANPIFAPFFLVNYETAHTIAAYAAAVGITVGIAASAFYLLKKQKTGAIKNLGAAELTKPLSSMPQPPKYALTKEDKTKKPEQTMPKPAFTENPPVKAAPKEDKPTSAPATKDDKIVCAKCKKEFSTPLLMYDYSTSEPKLASYCPYCNQPL